MIIGSGMMANTFSSYCINDDFIIFASGVSNSKETHHKAFKREKDLLLDTIKCGKDKILVYFSTCSIEDPSMQLSQYIEHKIEMEKLIMENIQKWYVFRLPQVVGPTKSPTLIHFLFEAIKEGHMLTLYSEATRNLIWHEDIYKIANEIISTKVLENKIINIASPFYLNVKDIVKLIEEEIGIFAKKRLIKKGAAYLIDTSLIEDTINKLEVFTDDYSQQVIKKYINLHCY